MTNITLSISLVLIPLMLNEFTRQLMDRPKLPQQCEVCWDFHLGQRCGRPQQCGRCSKAGYSTEGCTSPEQCPNCLEPALATHKDCPIRPYIARGVIRRPDQSQRKAIRSIGAKRYRQHNAELFIARDNASSSSPARLSPCPVLTISITTSSPSSSSSATPTPDHALSTIDMSDDPPQQASQDLVEDLASISSRLSRKRNANPITINE